MPAPLPVMMLFGLLLSAASLNVAARLHPAGEVLNTDNFQLLVDNLKNKNEVFLVPGAWLITRDEGDARHRQEMTPEQRDRLKERRKRFESLPPQEKQRLKDARKKFRQLPPEERKKLKQKWRDLSPEERDKAINKKRKKKA
ncbi:MAG: DUF3106 domain-containing protein [Gammaproteobacteria bacterium]|nr:DUF3106 domain-containing protein [Gammaproteobacteria bacterium]MBQ0838854.1 DUF3106 domain-containing protein [Gammaproteobacteria bacterium]